MRADGSGPDPSAALRTDPVTGRHLVGGKVPPVVGRLCRLVALIQGMDAFPDDVPNLFRPRVVSVELRGPAEEVAEVRAWIEARALYSEAEVLSVFGPRMTCQMTVVVEEGAPDGPDLR